MVRFIFILIGIFNLFIFPFGLAMPFHYLLKPVRDILPAIDIILIIALYVFLLFHSIRLIIFKRKSLKIQVILSSIDPFSRIFIIVWFFTSYINKTISTFTLIAFPFLYIAFDIFVIFYLRRSKTLEVIKDAEAWREEKERRKLMKNNMGKTS